LQRDHIMGFVDVEVWTIAQSVLRQPEREGDRQEGDRDTREVHGHRA